MNARFCKMVCYKCRDSCDMVGLVCPRSVLPNVLPILQTDGGAHSKRERVTIVMTSCVLEISLSDVLRGPRFFILGSL